MKEKQPRNLLIAILAIAAMIFIAPAAQAMEPLPENPEPEVCNDFEPPNLISVRNGGDPEIRSLHPDEVHITRSTVTFRYSPGCGLGDTFLMIGTDRDWSEYHAYSTAQSDRKGISPKIFSVRDIPLDGEPVKITLGAWIKDPRHDNEEKFYGHTQYLNREPSERPYLEQPNEGWFYPSSSSGGSTSQGTNANALLFDWAPGVGYDDLITLEISYQNANMNEWRVVYSHDYVGETQDTLNIPALIIDADDYYPPGDPLDPEDLFLVNVRAKIVGYIDGEVRHTRYTSFRVRY